MFLNTASGKKALSASRMPFLKLHSIEAVGVLTVQKRNRIVWRGCPVPPAGEPWFPQRCYGSQDLIVILILCLRFQFEIVFNMYFEFDVPFDSDWPSPDEFPPFLTRFGHFIAMWPFFPHTKHSPGNSTD